MKILELSLPDFRPSIHKPQSHVLSQIESSIRKLESHSPGAPLPEFLSSDLRPRLPQLSSLSPFPNSVKLQIWKLNYCLWNSCVDLNNAAGVRSSGQKVDEEHATFQQVSADLLFLTGGLTRIPTPALKSASFYYKIGLIWHDLRKFDFASNCFEKATDLTSNIEINAISDHEERKLLLDLNIARSRMAWEISDRNLAIRAKTSLNRHDRFSFLSALCSDWNSHAHS